MSDPKITESGIFRGMTLGKPVRVLCVDDSAFFRKVLSDILGHRPDIDLVGCVNDPYEARDRLQTSVVDVLTLDLEMPRMDGLTFLKLLMDRKPMPVIILSALTPTGSQRAIEALFAGAMAVHAKPASMTLTPPFVDKLARDIRLASIAPLRRRRPLLLNPCFPNHDAAKASYDPRQIIALGASTGGTQALEEILMKLPTNLPGIVVVQHIPAGFSARFAERLNRTCSLDVREAKDGDTVRPGTALIAPGDRHMEVCWLRDHYRIYLHDGPPVEHQRPSVDVLFESLATHAGASCVAVLLTGMGRDGAAGMKRLHDLRAHTIAQDADSSVVYGMARKAVELHAVDDIVPLENIASVLLKTLQQRRTLTATTTTHA
jgi:two-component system, chemotaxis family, protein-glutamate methylesterase/glutaminase